MSKGWFCGSSYTSQSVNADCQKTLNWYEERDESGSGKSQSVLYPTPGKRFFASLTTEQYIPSLFAFNGRLFSAGNHLFELFEDGFKMDRGLLNNPNGNPVTMSANQANQLLIACGGNLFVFDLAVNVVEPVDMTQLAGKVDQIGFTDTYFAALIRNSNTFQLSDLLDGTSWPGLNTSKITVFPENIVSMVVAFRELWFQGNKQSTAYEDTGNPNFPYEPVPSGFMEQGNGAQFSTVRMDNSCFWIGQDERGQGMAWRATGYTPQRVSTHAIEFAWSQYPRIDDSLAYAYQDQGHSFWVIYFPSANKTWVFDAATSRWHERASWEANTGRFVADRSRCHAFIWGRHFVGDWGSGTIYEMSVDFLTDVGGHPLRRIRRAPHLAEEDEFISHKSFQLAIEPGLGPEPTLPGPSLDVSLFPAFFPLEATDGSIWAVSVDNAGHIATTLIGTDPLSGGGFGVGGFGEGGFGGGSGAGVPTFVYLTDITDGTTSWQIGISPAGAFTSTPVAFDFLLARGISLSTPGGHTLNFQVTNFGNVETNFINSLINNPRGPIVSLRWSDNYGHSWSDYIDRDCGQAGEFRKRVIWRRIGRARDRVYEVSTADPFPARIIDAYLKTA